MTKQQPRKCRLKYDNYILKSLNDSTGLARLEPVQSEASIEETILVPINIIQAFVSRIMTNSEEPASYEFIKQLVGNVMDLGILVFVVVDNSYPRKNIIQEEESYYSMFISRENYVELEEIDIE